jgi:antitoxin MazE
MQTHFTKWGNSLALRIPKALAETISATDGSPATITVENGAIVVRPAAPHYTIEELCKGLKPMPEMDWSGPVGNEII